MIHKALKDTIAGALKDITDEKIEIILKRPSNDEHGDFMTNVAMQVAGKLKKNPREIAEAITKAIRLSEIVKKAEIAGPGFINITVTDEALMKEFTEIQQSENFGKMSFGQSQTAITEKSHPNVAKPMGVHHVLSTVIGEVVDNLLVNAGYHVIRDNFLGDWGTQFGKLIYAIQTWGDMDMIKKNPIDELLKLYVKFHDEAEKNPELEDYGRVEFKKLEDGNSESRKLWQWIREISLKEFENIWNRLGTHFDMINGEAFYEPKLSGIIDEGKRMGIVVEGERGALIVNLDDPNKPPCMLQKSDGASTYATRDLARIREWRDTYKAHLGIVIVDIAQKLHHEQVNEAAMKLGWNTNESVLVHFGRMQFPDGEMSTRKGKVVKLEDVLDEAEKRALEKIEGHNSELPTKEKKELARIMGLGAFKYNILSQNREHNYTFEWDKMLSFEGNSAPYLQYAYTRTQSIFRKAGQWNEQTKYNLHEKEEKLLIKKLMEFPEVLENATREYKPHFICTYLYELCQNFSTLYNNLPILQADEEIKNARLNLTSVFADVLKRGLTILTIEAPEQM